MAFPYLYSGEALSECNIVIKQLEVLHTISLAPLSMLGILYLVLGVFTA
jgi:hypothetical protein